MTLDSILNLCWLAIGAFALAGWGALEKRRRASRATARLLRLYAVLLVTVALFPCVSSSDDLFCFSFLFHPGQHGSGTTIPEDSREKADLHLARVLLALDQYRPAGAAAVAVSFAFFTQVVLQRRLCHSRIVLARLGRAPPSL